MIVITPIFFKKNLFLEKTGKSDNSEKTEKPNNEKASTEKDSKNESIIQEKSVLNESEINPDANQSAINQSHNISINQSLNQSVASCLICYEKLPDAVLMECGHGGWLVFN